MDKDAEANPSDEAGDCLGDRPASSNTRPVSNDVLEENGRTAVRCHHKELIPRMVTFLGVPDQTKTRNKSKCR